MIDGGQIVFCSGMDKYTDLIQGVPEVPGHEERSQQRTHNSPAPDRS